MGTVTSTLARKGVFLREATGLVREMNTFDVLAMNSFNISAGLGLAFVLYVGPSVFFNANIPLGVFLATLGGLCGAITFAMLTAMVPRSVTDYVLVTRTIHPALGFATNWTWAFWNIVWAGILTSFVSNWAMYDLFAIYGTMNNNPTLYNLAFSSGLWTLYPPSSFMNILIGTIIIAVFGVMLSVGPRVYLWFQRSVFVIGVIGLVTALIVMATTTHDTFVNNWNTYASTWQTNQADYNKMASFAGGSSTMFTTPLLATIGIMPVASWSLAYGQATTAVGGEIRRPNRTLPIGASFSVLLAGGIMLIGAYLFINVVGLNFISGAANSYYDAVYNLNTHAAWYGFYPSPFFDLWVSIANPNPIVTLLVGLGFICWILYYPGLDCLMNTRAALAWSFDWLGPAGLGKVSERFHTPIRAVALFSVLDWVALLIFSLYFSLVGSLTATLAVFVTMFLFMGIVGLVFPFLSKTKPIFNASSVRWRIGGVPVLTIAAIGWLIFLGIGTFYYLTEPNLAANKPIMLGISALVFIVAFPIYYLVKGYRARQGIDVTLAYKEIPPE